MIILFANDLKKYYRIKTLNIMFILFFNYII